MLYFDKVKHLLRAVGKKKINFSCSARLFWSMATVLVGQSPQIYFPAYEGRWTVRFISLSCDKYKSPRWLLKWWRLPCWGRWPTQAWNLCGAGVAAAEWLRNRLFYTSRCWRRCRREQQHDNTTTQSLKKLISSFEFRLLKQASCLGSMVQRQHADIMAHLLRPYNGQYWTYNAANKVHQWLLKMFNYCLITWD